VIEGACRHVVKDRNGTSRDALEDPAGAQALLNLRCIALNDEWEPFMNHYIHQENQTAPMPTARSNPNAPRFRLVA